eukprot:gene9516-17255_t
MAETLEDILEKATNPKNFGDNTTFANVFAEQINKEFDGPARAVKLISHKLSLHQEVVTLQTLTVLEVCVKNCGQRFHQEIGKYRFLNELIKLLSPKYDGGITSQAVKDRVAEIMYNLYVGLPSEMKIAEAYRMLKQQGVIKRDPVSDDATQRPANRPSNTALDDEEKSKLLAMLLKSKNPEDLQAANKLIKTMVKQITPRPHFLTYVGALVVLYLTYEKLATGSLYFKTSISANTVQCPFQTWCSVPYKHGAVSLANMVQCPLQTWCSVPYKYGAVSLANMVQCPLQTWCSVPYKHGAVSLTNMVQCPLQTWCSIPYKHGAVSLANMVQCPLQTWCSVPCKHGAVSLANMVQCPLQTWCSVPYKHGAVSLANMVQCPLQTWFSVPCKHGAVSLANMEEERLEKFSKRVQELETVSNNVDLLNEMIDAYSPSMSESDQVVMRDLYEACLSMRTQLFRIASQCVEDKDDTLSEILALSDDLTKAIDKYKRVVIQGEQITESTDASSENVQPSIENSNQPQNSVDSLLDIGLGFDDQPPTNASRQQTSSTSFLDEQFKMLGLDDGIPTSSINTINSQASAGYEWGAFGSASALPPQTAVPQQGQFYPNNQFNANLGNMGSIAPMMPSGNMVLKNYSMPQSQQIRPTNTTSGGAAQNKGTTGVTRAPANDLLGFDVFADFKKEDVKRTKEVDEAKNVDTKKATQAGSLLDLDDDNHVQNNLHSSNLNRFKAKFAANTHSVFTTTHLFNGYKPLIVDLFLLEKPEEKIEETKTESLSAVGGYFVPLEAIEPCELYASLCFVSSFIYTNIINIKIRS